MIKYLFFLFFLVFVSINTSYSQSYNDGPIEIQVKLKEVNTIFDATDVGQASTIASLATPDELSYILWAKDNLGGVWNNGGTCFTDDFTPAYNSGNGTTSADFSDPNSNFNPIFSTLSYPTAINPQFIDIKLDAWEDDNNSDAFTALSFVGITANTSGLRTDWDDYDCQVSFWLPFIGTTCLYSDGDDYRCLADPFKSGLDYRLGNPCEWYNHGFVQGDVGACVNTSSDPSAPNTNGYYEPHIETFWRYTKGTSFANAINLGVLPTSPTSLQHSNSNECYNNNYSASTGNDVIYSFDIINPTGVNISLCGLSGATFDSYLYLVNGNDTTTAIEMNDNSCGGLQSQILTSLCTPGIYYVVVDATDATEFGTFTLEITEDPANTFSVIDSISDYNGEDISCNAGADGKFYAHVNGGSPPYTFDWSNGVQNISNNNSDSITGLVAGNYSVTVSDSKGCILPPLSVTLTDPTLITVTTASTPAACAGYSDGVITVTNTSGGVPNYIYNWSDGQTGGNATSLLAGSYTLTVTDANGCSITHQEIVTEPAAPSMNITSSNASVNNNPITYEVCDGDDITLTASGANLVSYSWSPNIWLNIISGPTVISSPSGNMPYTCTATDAAGCTTDVVVQVNVVSSVNIYASSPNPQVCDGEDITVTFYGASTYSWFPPTYLNATSGSTVTITPQNSITYTITAQNASGCTDETQFFVDVLPAPNLNLSIPNLAICPNAFSTVSVSGAATYIWSPSNTLSSSIGSSVTASPSTTTQYKVVGIDNNGCRDSSNFSISVYPLSVLNVAGTSVICEGDTSTLTVSGAINYVWSPSSSLNVSSNNIVDAFPIATETYTISGTDLNSCNSETTHTISVLPTPIVSLSSSDDTLCIGSAVIFNAAGASQYSWQPSSTLNNNTGSTVSAMPNSTTIYTLTATDTNNCSVSQNIKIYVNPLPILTISPNSITICEGDSVNLSVLGAQDYLWSPALGLNTTIGSSVFAKPSITTNYFVDGMDANGCSDVISTLVNVNPNPIVSLSPSSADICNGTSVNITAFGADNYTWYPALGLNTSSGNSVNASPNTSITYSVEGTDNNNCSSTTIFQLNVGINPLVSVSPSNPIICEGDNIVLSVEGADQYAWFPSQSLSSSIGSAVSASPLSSTIYTVIGTDSLGCIDSVQTTISVNPKPLADLTINDNILICTNDSAMIIVELSGVPPWELSCAVNNTLYNQINTFSNPSVIYGNIEGDYTIPLVIDGNNCRNVGVSSVEVIRVNTPVADFDLTPQPTDVLSSEITFLNNSMFSNSWIWDFGDGYMDNSNFNTSHIFSAAGNYKVTLVVYNDICSDTIAHPLVIDPVYTIYVPDAFSPNNDGINDIFMPKGQSIDEFEMYIYNRWGEEVFYTENINIGWDGQYTNNSEIVVSTYTYIINITDELGVFHTLKGKIFLN